MSELDVFSQNLGSSRLRSKFDQDCLKHTNSSMFSSSSLVYVPIQGMFLRWCLILLQVNHRTLSSKVPLFCFLLPADCNGWVPRILCTQLKAQMCPRLLNTQDFFYFIKIFYICSFDQYIYDAPGAGIVGQPIRQVSEMLAAHMGGCHVPAILILFQLALMSSE